MPASQTPLIPLGDDDRGHAALRHSPWRKRLSLSSALDGAEHFLERAGFDRGPWLAVALAAGIAAWFALPGPTAWVAAGLLAIIVALGGLAAWRGEHGRARLLQSTMALALIFALGLGLVWTRSEMVGTPAIDRPMTGVFEGRVLQRIEQPAEERVRLVMAMRELETGRAIKVRVNVPLEFDRPALGEGAVLRFQARLMPPAPPMLPGAYNFSRSAWFEGLAATGSVQDVPAVIEPAATAARLAVRTRTRCAMRG